MTNAIVKKVSVVDTNGIYEVGKLSTAVIGEFELND